MSLRVVSGVGEVRLDGMCEAGAGCCCCICTSTAMAVVAVVGPGAVVDGEVTETRAGLGRGKSRGNLVMDGITQ